MNLNGHRRRTTAHLSRATVTGAAPKTGGAFTHFVALLTPIFVVLAAAVFGKPLFETNDDAALAMLGSGFGISAGGDAHLVYSHFGYGLIVRAMTRLVGPLAHGYLTLLALGLAMGLFTRALYASARPRDGLAASLLIIAVVAVFLRPLLEPQFTITAALLFGAAIACWLAMSSAGLRSTSLSVAIWAALIVSFLVRPSSGLLGIVVVSPVLIWLGWLGPADNRWPSRRLLAALVIVALLTFVTDWAAYAYSPAWRQVQEYNRVQSLFTDFHRVSWSVDSPEFRNAGWSANDYAMFLAWYSIHPIFDLDVLKHLVSTSHGPLLTLSGVPSWFNAAWQSHSLMAMTSIQVLLVVLMPRYRVAAALLLAGCMAATVIAGLSGRPPAPRVLYSTASIAVLCTLPLMLSLETASWLRGLASLALVAILSLYAGSIAIQEHLQRVRAADTYRATLADAKPYFSGKVIAWGDALAVESLITPTTIYDPFPDATMFPIGGFSRTPTSGSASKRMGITDLTSTLCTEPDVRLIATVNFVKMLGTFCAEHLQIRPVYDLAFDNDRTKIFVSRSAASKP